MNQKLSDWASIAEILGAGAIVISLVFVGLQISDGNREARAATTQATLDAEMMFQSELIENSEVWVRTVQQGDLSDPVDLRKAVALLNMAMTLNDNRYQMANAGYLRYEAKTIESMVQMPIFEIWRSSIGANSRSPEFLELVDRVRERFATE
jgi:hypothetical protein